jgi:anti-sigma regulatory factor (Ser/Thr protein kinase)
MVLATPTPPTSSATAPRPSSNSVNARVRRLLVGTAECRSSRRFGDGGDGLACPIVVQGTAVVRGALTWVVRVAEPDRTGYVHDAVVYGSDDELLAVAVPFLRGGLDAGEVVLARADKPVARLLSRAVGEDPRLMVGTAGEWYARPARAIAGFHRFFRQRLPAGGVRFRVLAEIRVADDPVAVAEWGRYEAVINEVFASHPVWGLCAFDTRLASPQLLNVIERTHPALVSPEGRRVNDRYVEPAEFLRSGLPRTLIDDLEATVPDLTVPEVTDLRGLRRVVRDAAARWGPVSDTVHGLVVAVNEVVENAMAHGGPPVGVRLWGTSTWLVCTVTDTGAGVADPFAGFRASDAASGLGLVRQLCDHVDLRVTSVGFTVRLASRR